MKRKKNWFATITAGILGASMLFSGIQAFAWNDNDDDSTPGNEQGVYKTTDGSVSLQGEYNATPYWGMIGGYLWNDADGDGVRTAAETPATGETVELQVQDGSDWKTQATMQTDAAGGYKFDVMYNTYRVKFPTRPGKLFTQPNVNAGSVPKTSSDADANGFTPAGTIDGTTKQIQWDAGYTDVFSIISPDKFNKYVYFNNQLTGVRPVSSPAEPITYSIQLQLDHMPGYAQMKLIDKLDQRLQYQSAKIYANGQDITSFGSLDFNSANNVVSFDFATPLDRTLAGKTIEMRLVALIDNSITEYSDITNKAEFVVNGVHTLHTPTQAVLRLEYGYISGYAFEDTTGSGLRDENSKPLKNMEIQLMQQQGLTQKAVATARTNAQGQYTFLGSDNLPRSFPFGKYTLKATHVDTKLYDYTKMQATGTGYNGYCSDANPKTGLAAFTVSSGLRQPQPSIGLVKKGQPEPPPEELPKELKKLPTAEIVNPGDIVSYTISGFGNTGKKPVKKCGVSDIVPEGLNFEMGVLPAFANGAGTQYSIEYLTNQTLSPVTLHSGLPADQPFRFYAPGLAEGERITIIRVRMEQAPAGFGVGDTILFQFRVSENNTNKELVNAAMWFQGDRSSNVKSPTVKGKNTEKTEEVRIESQEESTLAEEQKEKTEVAEIEEMPLTQKAPYWSFTNVMIVAAGLMLQWLILYLRRRNRRKEAEDLLTTPGWVIWKSRIYSFIPFGLWCASLLVLIFTQNWKGYMSLLPDIWTTMLVLLNAASLVFALPSIRKIARHRK